MRLFHYTSLNTFLEFIMKHKTLRTNNLNTMNDPREAERWAFGGTNVPYSELFPVFYSEDTHIECQFRLGQMIKDRFQVMCFSGAQHNGWDNEMMWAHYADRQRGICLEFDEQELITGLLEQYPETTYYMQNVNYLKKQKDGPWLEWNQGEDMDWNFKQIQLNHYSRLIFHKSHFWEKEDERRLLVFGDQHVYLPIEKALKAVHVGIGCHHSYIHAVHQMIKETEVRLYGMVYQHDRYERWLLKKVGDRFRSYS